MCSLAENRRGIAPRCDERVAVNEEFRATANFHANITTIISNVNALAVSRKRNRPSFNHPPYRHSGRLYHREIRDVPWATVTNVFVYRQAGRQVCHTRTRNARKSVARGLKRCLERWL